MAVDPVRAKSLFLAASDLADPAVRAAYLDRECGGDVELRRRVEALLQANDAAPMPEPGVVDTTGAFASEPPATATFGAAVPEPTAHHPDRDEQAGAVIGGKYTLVEVIGEGGMGAVWRAKQTEPVKRFVAVKLIKAGMDSRQVLARFEAERQALALMDHPNIAKVLDGGLTSDGRPYFVMELVKGVPITEYCDAHKLTPKERLELFVPVCQAIQHAHQKGLIHRDIKPSNVLIALYDDKPVPKVIDFGVAKATGGALTERTIDTGFGGVVGTPQYMSPEQATFNNLDIDTRSDVYALGVLLYELLTGSPPFSKKELEQKGLLEVLRVIREEDPPRPSTKLSTADALPTLSDNRGTEPRKLTGLLRNELDWIVMKALEKDRARRYDTANGFAMDVQRYLAGEAVQAHPPSAGYRLKKFVRRNKVQVIAASLVFGALVLGMAGTTFGLFRATEAEASATKALVQVTDEQGKTKAALTRATDEEAKARAADADSRKQLARQYVERGWKLAQGGNPTEALHWFIAAFAKEQDLIDRDREQAHRLRIAAVMEACPRPTHVLFHPHPVRQAVYSPDGKKLATLAWTNSARPEIRVWDTSSGKPIGSSIQPTPDPDLTRVMYFQFTADGSKIVLRRQFAKKHLKTEHLIAQPLSGLEAWDVESGQVGMPLKICLAGNGTQQTQTKLFAIEFHDPAAPAWPPRAIQLVDLKTLRHTDSPPITGPPIRLVTAAFSPTDQYCVVPAGYGGPGEIWALNPPRRVAEWAKHVVTNPQAWTPGIWFTDDGSRFFADVYQPGTQGDSVIHSLETTTGRELFTPRPVGSISGMDVSPDGKRFLTVTSERLTLYDGATGQRTVTHNAPPNRSFSLSGTRFDSTGTRVQAVSLSSTTRSGSWSTRPPHYSSPTSGRTEVLAAATMQPIMPTSRRTTTSPANSLALLEDDQGTMQFWNVRASEPLTRIIATEHQASGATPAPLFSPDGRLVLTRTDEAVRLWDAAIGQLSRGPFMHRAKITGSEFNPAFDQLFTISEDGTACLWDTNPDPIAPVSYTRQQLAILQLDPSGNRLIARSNIAGDPELVWDIAGGQQFNPQRSFVALAPKGIANEAPIVMSDIQFAAGGRSVYSTARGLGFWIWDFPTGRVLQHQPCREREHFYAALSPDGLRIMTIRTPDGEVRWWDALSGQPIGNPVPGESTSVRLGVMYQDRPNPFLVTLRFRTEAGKPLEVEPTVWDPAREEPTRFPWRPAVAGTDVKYVFHVHPELPITAGDRTLDPQLGPDGRAAGWRLLDNSSGRELVLLPAGEPEFIADNRRVALHAPGQLTVWDAATGARLSSIPLPRSAEAEVRFNRDASRVVVAARSPGTSRHSVPILVSAPRMWDVTTGRPVAPPMIQSERLIGFEWSPDGRRLASWAGREVQIWDGVTGQALGTRITLATVVRQVRFSPNGQILAIVTPGDVGRSGYVRSAGPALSLIDRRLRTGPMLSDNELRTTYTGAYELEGQLTLWDAASGEPVALPTTNLAKPQYPVMAEPVFTALFEVGPVFSPDGRRLFTTPTPNSVRAWSIPTDDRSLAELTASAEALSGRRFQELGGLGLLTVDEWKSRMSQVAGSTAEPRTPEQQLRWHRELATTHYDATNWRIAQGHLNRLIAAGANESKLYHMRGWCRFLTQDPEGALADLNRAVEMGADGWEIWAMRGAIYQEKADWERAAADFRRLDRFPDAGVPPGWRFSISTWWSGIGRVMAWKGDAKDYRWACDQLRMKGGLQPPYTSADFTTFLYAPGGLDDYKPVIDICRGELSRARTPNMVATNQSRLAWTLYRAGEYADAVRTLEAIDPNVEPNQIYRYGGNALVLAMAYARLGQVAKAEPHLRLGLEQVAKLQRELPLNEARERHDVHLGILCLVREAKQLIRPAGAIETAPPPREKK